MRDFKTIGVRLNKIEADAITQLAREQDVTMAEALRNLLHCTMEKKRQQAGHEEADRFKSAY
jgi:hypothetical protein